MTKAAASNRRRWSVVACTASISRTAVVEATNWSKGDSPREVPKITDAKPTTRMAKIGISHQAGSFLRPGTSTTRAMTAAGSRNKSAGVMGPMRDAIHHGQAKAYEGESETLVLHRGQRKPEE